MGEEVRGIREWRRTFRWTPYKRLKKGSFVFIVIRPSHFILIRRFLQLSFFLHSQLHDVGRVCLEFSPYTGSQGLRVKLVKWTRRGYTVLIKVVSLIYDV